MCEYKYIYIYTVHELLWVNDVFFPGSFDFFPDTTVGIPPPWHAPQRAWLPPSLGAVRTPPEFFAWEMSGIPTFFNEISVPSGKLT